MSRNVFIQNCGDIEKLGKDFQKAFYKKAFVSYYKGTYYLQSYDTIVASITEDKVFHRLWSGWSATTARHVATFCNCLGVKAPNKKEWYNMPYEVDNKKSHNWECLEFTTKYPKDSYFY